MFLAVVLLQVLSRGSARVPHTTPALEHVEELGIFIVLEELYHVVPAVCWQRKRITWSQNVLVVVVRDILLYIYRKTLAAVDTRRGGNGSHAPFD